MKIAASSTHHPLHARRRKLTIPLGAQRFLAAFEGFEGGFAIGTSIIVALSFSNLDRTVLLSTALLSITVNGFNSASMKYTSEHYMDELDGSEKKNKFRHYFLPAITEFAAYIVISLFAIVPMILLNNMLHAVWIVAGITLVILFAAGFMRGYMLRMSPWRDGLEALVLGFGIILVGFIFGYLVYATS
ncbi:VIT1/CCC1 transporter family protein [Candidatus Saccharibacteria bacterium]|jgi:VIT1/CCC1 family predicted Fe2+/Mn2+ transporter|nr:VIT1/CCC1 transporter family protein [Candidatus Saccharibacteria bacterium]